MPVSRRDLLRWQFDLTWSLFELHLEQLKPEDFRWEPATRCTTMRPGVGGGWVPDWPEPEPEPAPIPTIGWVSWHIGWWWTVTLDHAQGRVPRDRGEIEWPGDGRATVEWLHDLRPDWLAVLDGLTDPDLDATAPFPWRKQSRTDRRPYGRMGELRTDEERRRDRPTPAAACRVRGMSLLRFYLARPDLPARGDRRRFGPRYPDDRGLGAVGDTTCRVAHTNRDHPHATRSWDGAFASG